MKGILFIVFAVNLPFILMLAYSLNGVYQKKCLDILELSFLVHFRSYTVLHTHTRGRPGCCDLDFSWSGPYQVCCSTSLAFLLECKHQEVHKRKHSSTWLTLYLQHSKILWSNSSHLFPKRVQQ